MRRTDNSSWNRQKQENTEISFDSSLREINLDIKCIFDYTEYIIITYIIIFLHVSFMKISSLAGLQFCYHYISII